MPVWVLSSLPSAKIEAVPRSNTQVTRVSFPASVGGLGDDIGVVFTAADAEYQIAIRPQLHGPSGIAFGRDALDRSGGGQFGRVHDK